MPHHSREPQVVPIGEFHSVAGDGGIATDRVVAPIGIANEPRLIEAASNPSAEKIWIGRPLHRPHAVRAERPGSIRRPVGAEHEVIPALEVTVGVDRLGGDAEVSRLHWLSWIREIPGAHQAVRAILTAGLLRHREENAVVVRDDRRPSLVRSIEPTEKRSRSLRYVGKSRCHGRVPLGPEVGGGSGGESCQAKAHLENTGIPGPEGKLHGRLLNYFAGGTAVRGGGRLSGDGRIAIYQFTSLESSLEPVELGPEIPDSPPSAAMSPTSKPCFFLCPAGR